MISLRVILGWSYFCKLMRYNISVSTKFESKIVSALHTRNISSKKDKLMKLLFILSICFLISSLTGVYHQDWAEYFDSEIYECEIHDGYLYVVTANEGLSVFTYNPDQPLEFIANYPDIATYHLLFDEQYAYVVNYSLPINKFDVSDPENIEFVGSIQAPMQLVNNAINDIYIKSDLLCIASYYDLNAPHNHQSDTYIDIFDIQDLTNIVHLTCIHASFGFEGVRAHIHYLNSENYLYVTSLENLEIYDCNDLQNISFQNSFYTQTPIFVNENYVVNRSSSIYEFISNTDISLIDDLTMNAYSAFQSNNVIIINETNSVSHFYDLSTNEITDHYWCYGYKPCYDDEMMFLTDENILQGIDIRYSDNPDILFNLFYYANDFKIENDEIFFEIDEGIGVIDLNDPQFTLHELIDDNFDDYLIANDMVLTFKDHYDYHDFKIHDIQNINNITLLNSFQLPEIGDPYIILDNLVYCFQSETLKILSIIDPLNPVIVNEVNFSNHYKTFLKINLTLLMFGSGAATVDISDPSNPVILMETILPSNPSPSSKVFFIEDYVYLYSAGSTHTLHIYDYSDPLNPMLLSTLSDLDIDRMFMVNGNLAAIKTDFNEIRFYELFDHIPSVASKYNWNNPSYYLGEYDDYVLVACRDFGIYALSMGITQIDDYLIQIGEKSILSNYPNPFNPTTKIEFSIQNESQVGVSIYNIKGQKIKTIAHDQFTKGSHSINWNSDDDYGKPVGSGIYFYKLNINGKTEAVKKCLLLK